MYVKRFFNYRSFLGITSFQNYKEITEITNLVEYLFCNPTSLRNKLSAMKSLLIYLYIYKVITKWLIKIVLEHIK